MNESFHNTVTLVGLVEPQRVHGRQVMYVQRRNPASGWEARIVMQLPSPLGYQYAQPLTIDLAVQGHDQLDQLQPDCLVEITGQLIWRQYPDWRYAQASEAFSAPYDLGIRAEHLRLAIPGQLPGTRIQLSGPIATSARQVNHPHNAHLCLITTSLDTVSSVQDQSTGFCMQNMERIPIAIPWRHPDAPNLMRNGNQVRIEGMLDRYSIRLSGDQVTAAQTALDRQWAQQRSLLTNPAEQARAEQRHQRRRAGLAEAQRGRVVAGSVELLTGTPASFNEARELRQRDVRNWKNPHGSVLA